MSDDDAPLIPPPSPWPVVAGHLAGVGLHLAVGAVAVGIALMAPPPWESAGEPWTKPRFWAMGLCVFATLASIGFSTGFSVASTRLIATFKKLAPGPRSAALAVALIGSHLLACAAALAAVGVWITATMLG